MRFTRALVNSVVFLCVEETTEDGREQRVPKASGFLVRMLFGEFGIAYVVTARHCIEETRGRQFWVRTTTAAGGIFDVVTQRDDWFVHDSADVAVAVFHPRTDEPINLNAFGMEQFVGGDYTVPLGESQLFEVSISSGEAKPDPSLEVEVGDNVIFLGLFVQHPGRERNLPVARFGHISRMPEEPILFERTDGSTARLLGYLAECHSWGGHSGGPVIWERDALHFTQMTVPEGMPGPAGETVWVQTPGIKQGALLGLVSGHFDIAQKADVQGDVLGEVTQRINAGMAVVTPADAIRELLMREDVVADRDKRLEGAEEERDRKNAATFDSGVTPADDDEFGRFEDLTRQLVNTPKPKPEDES